MTCDRCFAEMPEDTSRWEHVLIDLSKYLLCEDCCKDFNQFLEPKTTDDHSAVLKRINDNKARRALKEQQC